MKKYISSLILSIIASVGILSAVVSAQSFISADPNAGVGNFCTYVNRAIPYGERSDLVAHLQTLLRSQYSYNVSSTGYFGPVTYNLVKQIQRNLRINYPTGSLGPITLGRLRAVWCTGNVVNPGQGNIQISLSPIVSQGYNVTLGWNTQNATSCTLNGESVSLSGSKIVYVTYDTAYKMVCSNSVGETKEQSLLVRPGTTTSGNLPVINFSISPNSTVYAGQVVYLNWSATNATSCSLNGNYANISGIQAVTVPNTATSYVLSCTGVGGTSSQTINLNNSGTSAAYPVINSFVNNSNSYLSWSTSNASSCTLSGQNFYNQAVSVNGNQYLPSYQNGSTVGPFTLTCVNSLGQSTSQTIQATGGTTSTGSVTTNSTSYAVNATANISWSAPSSYASQVQGVILSLYDSNNNYIGHIARPTTSLANGSYSWSIPKVIYGYGGDVMSCITVDGQQYCGLDPKMIPSGSYKVRAAYFTPSNACFGFCPQVAGQQTLGNVDSSVFTIAPPSNLAVDTSYWNQFVLKFTDLTTVVKLYESYLSNESDYGWTKLLTYNIVTSMSNLDQYNTGAKAYIAQNGSLYSSYEITNDASADTNRVIVNIFTLKDTSRQYYEVSIEKLYIKNNQVYRVVYAEKVPFSNSTTENTATNQIYTKYTSTDFINSFLYKKFNF
jgi:hypothetical protein